MAKESEKKETTLDVSMDEVKEVKRTDNRIVFKVNKPVSKTRFALIDAMVRGQMEKSGLKIVLMPYSCDLKE